MLQESHINNLTQINKRFRGFLPVVVDVETAGLDPHRHALLEVSVVLLQHDIQGMYARDTTYFEHIIPFEGSILDSASLAFNKIDPYQPLRFAVEEKIALKRLFKPIFKALSVHRCQRAVLVGHNAWFDLLFIKKAAERTGLKLPFHLFTCFDTATLAGLVYGQTVLARAMQCAHIPFDTTEAHSAVYDAEKTADLFCAMLNKWHQMIL